MPIKAIDLNKVTDFISQYDDPKDPTVWKLGTLTSREAGVIRDSMTQISMNAGQSAGQQIEISRTKMAFEAVRYGLKGWENFLGTNGNPIKYKQENRELGGVGVKAVPFNLLEQIPLEVIQEMADKLMADHMSDADAVGN